MKIATFNINNINKRLQNLLAWLRTSKPEVVCLQELKAADREFPKASLYAPNWMDRLTAHAADLFAAGVPVVLAGDYNVIPTDRDIYPTKSYAKDALLQPESRARFARILGQGWTDAIRSLHPNEPMYTYWSYLRDRWP